MYYGREWWGITPENFMQYVDTYIRWYNEQRIKLSLGAISPEIYRRQLGSTDLDPPSPDSFCILS